MPTPSPKHLKIHVEAAADAEAWNDLPAWNALQTSLRQLTGRHLECKPAGRSNPHDSTVATLPQFYGHEDAELIWRADDSNGSGQVDPRYDELTCSIGLLLRELQFTRVALHQREIELATAIPAAQRLDSTSDFNHRLQAVLRGTVEGLCGQAAALYLLDDETTELKLRCQWGLSSLRFLEPARPLRGALADLEALTGHAVVLEDTQQFQHWNVPEAFASAVCVPVSSESTVLGTLWLFAGQVRDYLPRETQLLEIIAGRLSVELQQRVLMREAATNSSYCRAGQSLQSWHQQRATQPPPLLDGWQVAGALVDAAEAHGDFHTWRVSDPQRLCVASAAVSGSEPCGPSTSILLQGATRAIMIGDDPPDLALGKLNETLWSSSAERETASVFYGHVDLRLGQLDFATAGSTDAYILRPHGWEPIATDGVPLGAEPDWTELSESQLVHPGDVVVVVSDRHLARDEQSSDLDTPAMAEVLLRHMHLSADELAQLAARLVREQCQQPWARSILIVKRCDHQ